MTNSHHTHKFIQLNWCYSTPITVTEYNSFFIVLSMFPCPPPLLYILLPSLSHCDLKWQSVELSLLRLLVLFTISILRAATICCTLILFHSWQNHRLVEAGRDLRSSSPPRRPRSSWATYSSLPRTVSTHLVSTSKEQDSTASLGSLF